MVLAGRLRQFLVYVGVGGFVGIVSIGIREIIGLILPDTPTWYAISVAIAYGSAILLSFQLHKRITFAGALDGAGTAAPLAKFTAVAVFGLITSTLLAPAIRYGLTLDELIGEFAPFAAFVAACLVVAVISYALNAAFTFVPKQDE